MWVCMDEALITVGSLGIPEIIQVGPQRSSFSCRHGYLFGFGLHRHWKGQNARFLRRRETMELAEIPHWTRPEEVPRHLPRFHWQSEGMTQQGWMSTKRRDLPD